MDLENRAIVIWTAIVFSLGVGFVLLLVHNNYYANGQEGPLERLKNLINTSQQQTTPTQEPIPIPTSNVTNTKYLVIKEQHVVPPLSNTVFGSRINQGTIVGTIVNNSTFPISFPSVDAILYNKNNTIITVLSNTHVDISPLGGGQESHFSMDLSLGSFSAGGPTDVIDHYTLIPVGTPY